MTDSNDVKVEKKKFSFFSRKKQQQIDEYGNPLVLPKKKRFSYHRLNRSFGGDLALSIVLFVGGVFMLFPLIYSISNSLKPLSEQWLFPPNLIVKNPTFEWYISLFNYMGNSMVPMSRYLFNSIYLCFMCTLVCTLSCSMAAYAISKRHFKGQETVFKLVELSMMFTAPATGIVSYVILANLNPVDQYWTLIVPCCCNSMYMYIVKNYMDTFPTSVLEAARIDGAGEFRIFWGILMPGANPAWMTVILFAVQAYWNMGTGYFIFKEEMKGISAGITAITSISINRTGIGGAASILLMIVPLVTFVITQSNVLDTCATAGMKD